MFIHFEQLYYSAKGIYFFNNHKTVQHQKLPNNICCFTVVCQLSRNYQGSKSSRGFAGLFKFFAELKNNKSEQYNFKYIDTEF